MSRLLYIASLCFFCLASCKSVYYNTFYNARQKYLIAEQKRVESETPGSRITPATYRALYQRAIVKASIVLTYHPKSKWFDDCLLLIGKASYWREDYAEALTKFQELQKNFPQSELIPESRYWQGLSLWAMNRIADARATFSLFGPKADAELYGLANLALAEMEATQDNREDAIESYHALLNTLGKKHELRAKAWQGVGNNLLELGRYDEALDAYENVLKSKPDTKTNFETHVKIGETLERQREFDKALDAYRQILKIKRLRIYEAETQLKQAHVHRQKGELETAEEIYDAIAKKYPRSEYSAAAFYRLGLIEQKGRKDLEKAKELFEKAVREDRGSDAGARALQRQKDLRDLERYRKQAEGVQDSQKVLAPLFNLAELYLFNLGEPDSALGIYQRVLGMTDSSDFAPKARYAIGLIYADSLRDEAAGREQFELLIDEFPHTPYALEARARLDQTHADDVRAEARFLEAETLIADSAATEDVMTIYRQIAADYPQSPFAPQALFALAWTYENDLDQLDRAKAIYEQVQERYPLTQYGKIATDKLEGDFLNPNPPPADSTMADSTAVSLSDSTMTDVTAVSPSDSTLSDSTTVSSRDSTLVSSHDSTAVSLSDTTMADATAASPSDSTAVSPSDTTMADATAVSLSDSTAVSPRDTTLSDSTAVSLSDTTLSDSTAVSLSDSTLVSSHDSTAVSLSDTTMADATAVSLSDTAMADSTAASQPDATVPPIQPKPAFKPNAIIGGGVMEATDADQEPQLIDEIEPEYPEAAKADGKPAVVMLRLLVSKDGRVGKVEVLSGPELFHSAAIAVATQYEFEPGVHEDVPRDMWHDISIYFEPPE